MPRITLMFVMLLTLAVNALACAPTPTPTTIPAPPVTSTPTAVPTAMATPQPSSFTDAFAYCRAVGTIDAPDARYTGDKVPEAVAKAIQKAMGLAPDMPLQILQGNSFWRCMDGKVYGCSVGANIPCQSKADTSKTPNDGMTQFCAANPASDFIPAVATGRETIYAWKCVGGKPQIDKPVFTPDARGFIKEFWYALSAQ